ncbi:hypothetical protein [Blastopirellula marina]|uniref:Uncharacterized protein n=1 Tax=Blastopirellula marina DSM 3645 TaxID=314230 RepID=A4A266_9BACT|nr:hypothetical protein [Blastopirellula marina]EAQ77169.1 hypothetical protein DSM3645_15235 [Blastopirellula marina DSM 3645]
MLDSEELELLKLLSLDDKLLSLDDELLSLELLELWLDPDDELLDESELLEELELLDELDLLDP